MLSASAQTALVEVLDRARAQGFVGPAPAGDHLGHALGFTGVSPPATAVDLGSGAGFPGLVLALAWPASRWVLLDANQRRTAFATAAVDRLGLDGRVVVLCERAEEAGRRAELRGASDVVVARGFGQPAVTAECGAPLLAQGGHLVVSEPPGGSVTRWPAAPLATLGLVASGAWRDKFSFQALRQEEACPDRYPRRVGVPRKRPLF